MNPYETRSFSIMPVSRLRYPLLRPGVDAGDKVLGDGEPAIVGGFENGGKFKTGFESKLEDR